MHPQGPTTDPLGKSSGKWGPQCGWLGGHLSEKGRVQTQRTTTLTPCSHPPRWGHRTSYKYTGHQLEAVVWESIVQSLTGAVVDMAMYMGPTTSMAHILQKLMVNFGTVVSFNVLMQNMYQVMDGNLKKVLSFAMRLEGTLNQIRLGG